MIPIHLATALFGVGTFLLAGYALGFLLNGRLWGAFGAGFGAALGAWAFLHFASQTMPGVFG